MCNNLTVVPLSRVFKERCLPPPLPNLVYHMPLLYVSIPLPFQGLCLLSVRTLIVYIQWLEMDHRHYFPHLLGTTARPKSWYCHRRLISYVSYASSVALTPFYLTPDLALSINCVVNRNFTTKHPEILTQIQVTRSMFSTGTIKPDTWHPVELLPPMGGGYSSCQWGHPGYLKYSGLQILG